jgi:hypothetical protein
MNSPTYRFIPAMFHAVMQRRKTQTRRVMTPIPPDGFVMEQTGPNEWHIGGTVTQRVTSPFGPPGTVKPVVTTWAVHRHYDFTKPQDLRPEGLPILNGIWWDDGVTPKPDWAGKSRPSMFFPSHLYHLAPQARCVAVKVERVQDISEADAIAEGIQGVGDAGSEGFGRFAFSKLWDSINERRGYGWAVNPLVFATTFELVQ